MSPFIDAEKEGIGGREEPNISKCQSDQKIQSRTTAVQLYMHSVLGTIFTQSVQVEFMQVEYGCSSYSLVEDCSRYFPPQ